MKKTKKKTKKKTTDPALVAAREEAASLRQREGVDGLARATWEALFASDRVRVRALRDEARQCPELARSFVVLDWVKDEGFCRDGLRLDDELDAAAVGLATRGDPRILPFAVALSERVWAGAALIVPWLDTDRAPRTELTQAARQWLAREPPDVDTMNLSARVLGAWGSPSDAALLADAFDGVLAQGAAARWRMGCGTTRYALGETIFLLAEALVHCGVPRSLLPVLEHAFTTDLGGIRRARSACALLLPSFGVEPGLAWLEKRLERCRDARAREVMTPGELLAIGALAKPADDARRAGVTRALEAAQRDDEAPLHALARRLALRDLGVSVDAEAAFARALAGGSRSDAEKHALAALRIAHDRADLDVGAARALVLSSSMKLHRAALRTLRSHRAEVVPFRLYDPLTVGELRERGEDALLAALQDESGLMLSNVVLHFVEHPSERARVPLLALAKRQLRAGDETAIRWTLQALARVPDASVDGFMNELLCKAAEDDADGADHAALVLRHAEALGPGVMHGMATIFATRENWMQREAVAWLRRHPGPPCEAALAVHGLAPEDLKLMSR